MYPSLGISPNMKGSSSLGISPNMKRKLSPTRMMQGRTPWLLSAGAVTLNRDQVKQLGWRLDGYTWFDWHIWCFSQSWALKVAVIGAASNKALKTTKGRIPGKRSVKSPMLSFFFILQIIKYFFYCIDLSSVRPAAIGWETVCWGNKPLVFHT